MEAVVPGSPSGAVTGLHVGMARRLNIAGLPHSIEDRHTEVPEGIQPIALASATRPVRMPRSRIA